MNVMITGRPRRAASETGLPFWSASRKPGARTAPAAQVALGASDPGGAPLFDELCPRPTRNSPSAAANPTSSTAPQSQRSRRTGPGAATDGGCTATTLSERIASSAISGRVVGGEQAVYQVEPL